MVRAESLADALGSMTSRLWPTRTQQERLFDLRERKDWGPSELRCSVDCFAKWTSRMLGLPDVIKVQPRGHVPSASEIRALISRLLPGTARGDGVGAAIAAIAPAIGNSGKTIANSLSRGLTSRRRDHRWLLALRRTCVAAPLDAWVFHRRNPEAVTRELAARAAQEDLDAGDAMLLVSLIALWQRRRPTSDARGNRGHAQSRRETPKPVAALGEELVAPGQIAHLTALATHLDRPHAEAMLWLTWECALTEAHLAPHLPRAGGHRTSGETFLVEVERSVIRARERRVISAREAEVVAFRIASMRAYRDRQPLAAPSPAIAQHSYVAACWQLTEARLERRVPIGPSDPWASGLMMLLPSFGGAGKELEK